jgi:hypothetical protein
MMLIADNGTLNFVPPTLVCTYLLKIMIEKWSAPYLHAILALTTGWEWLLLSF